MRAVVQRSVLPATVKVDGAITGAIDKGLIVYLGITAQDSKEDIEWLARKLVLMRIFSDEAGKMNKALTDIGGGLLIISQFTLYASTKKGNRPSYLRSAGPEFANKLYEEFVEHVKDTYEVPVGTGIFGADMKVEYTNDGPVTIIMDTENKE